jgi:hypothetical protein
MGGCSTGFSEFKKTDKVMSVIERYSKKIKKEKNIERRSYGFGVTNEDKVYDGKIHSIDLAYSIDKNLQYDEARKLFYEVVDGLIQAINAHPEISDEFYHYPIGYQDLEVSLSFDYESKGHLKKDDVSAIYIWYHEEMCFIVEKEGKEEVEKKWITPNIYTTEGLGSTTRCIIKKLSETSAP